MQCPPEIAAIVQEILRIGILRIRACGWKRDAERCAIEADHLHNLPALLNDYRPELLEYYLQVECVSFANKSNIEDLASFQQMWDSLAECTKPARKHAG